MKQLKIFYVLTFCALSAISITAKAGTDFFKVYLNNKLVLEQYVSEAFNLQMLELDKANVNDKLTFHYSHCGGVPGKDRKIALTDGNGKIVKAWKFADQEGKHSGMVVPVKELLQYHQSKLRFVYSATQLPKGQLIAGLQVSDQRTGWVPFATDWLVAMVGWSWNVLG